MWLRTIVADAVDQIPMLSQQAQAQAASQTYDKPVNWWLAWGLIGLTVFAGGIVGLIIWQLLKNDKKLDMVRDEEAAFLRQTVMGVLNEIKAEVVKIKELLLTRRSSRSGGDGP